MNHVLARWNHATSEDAQNEILPCNGAHAWAHALCSQRPYVEEAQLFAEADTVWLALDPEAQQQAFNSHPRIGEFSAKAASAASLAWSAGEQSDVSTEDLAKAALEEGNRAYEAKFGRIFLICATGKSTEHILASLQQRLEFSADAEWAEAVEQQRRITQLRLRKWLGLPAARCEDV